MNLHSPTRPFAWIGGSLAVLVLGFVLFVSLGDSESEVALAPETASELPVGTAAMRVAIDPETGALVPDHSLNKGLDADMQNMLNRSSEGLVEVVHPDGHVSVDLQGRFMSASVARIDQDGQLETTCVESAEALNDFLNGEEHTHTHDHAEAEVK
jgi:hypothetical protein